MKNQTVAERLETLMWNERLSQNKFARHIGVSNVTISRILRGETNPSMETLEQVTKAFPNLNPTWLLTGAGSMQLDQAPADALVKGAPPEEKKPVPVEVPGVNPILEELRLLRQEMGRAMRIIESQQEMLRKHSGNREHMMPSFAKKVA